MHQFFIEKEQSYDLKLNQIMGLNNKIVTNLGFMLLFAGYLGFL